jgi:hypothetical protein
VARSFKKYYILKRHDADGGWENWTYVQSPPEWGEKALYVSTHLEATPFLLRDDAEKRAFELAVLNPDLIGKLKVELVAL